MARRCRSPRWPAGVASTRGGSGPGAPYRTTRDDWRRARDDNAPDSPQRSKAPAVGPGGHPEVQVPAVRLAGDRLGDADPTLPNYATTTATAPGRSAGTGAARIGSSSDLVRAGTSLCHRARLGLRAPSPLPLRRA
jgi:hypothetical protein